MAAAGLDALLPSSDAAHFHLRARREMDGYEGDRRVHSHNIERSFKRECL